MSDVNKAITAKKSYETMCRALDRMDLKYTEHPDDLVITCAARGEDIPMEIIAKADADRSNVKLRSLLPFTVKEDKRVDFAIALSAINTALVNGCFEFDISSGNVIFRITTSTVEGVISEEAAAYMFMATFAIVDEYNDKLLMLDKGLISIEQFLALLAE